MSHKRSTSRSGSSAANLSRASSSTAAKQRSASAAQGGRASTRVASPAITQQDSRKPVSFAEIFRSHPILFGLGILGFLAVVVYAIALSNTPSTSAAPLAVGKSAPNFALTASDGNTYSLSKYRGKVVVLEFFAPWCPHCRNETSVLNQIASTDAGKGVQVLSVTATPYGYNYESSGGTDTTPISMNDVKEFVSNFHVKYPAMLDTSLKVGNSYGVTSYPQMFVINSSGKVTWNNGQSGEESYQTLQSVINQALQAPATPAK